MPAVRDPKAPRTYVTLTDRQTKRSECLTVYGVTTKQLKRAIKRGVAAMESDANRTSDKGN